MPTAKTPNYTEAQVERMREVYTPVQGESEETRKAIVAELAVEFGKKPRSVIAKLSNIGIYVSKTKVSTVTGAEPAKKLAIATELVDLVTENVDFPENVSRPVAETLEKANKTDLSGLMFAFRQLIGPETEETEETEIPATD